MNAFIIGFDTCSVMVTLLFTGSVTAKDSEAASQLQDSKDVSKESRESCNTQRRSATEEQKVVFSVASDTDSVDSLEIPSKTEQDTDSHPDEDSSKALDSTDSGLFAQRAKRLSSSDSYLSHQDSMKSMPWYGSSLDFDVGPYAKFPGSESQQLDKISESSLETKLDDLHLGHGHHRAMNRTSTPTREVRFAPGDEEGSAVPLKPLKEEFDHDTGSRSSRESSGRGWCLVADSFHTIWLLRGICEVCVTVKFSCGRSVIPTKLAGRNGMLTTSI